MSSIIKTLVVAALAALGVSCAWVGSRTEPVSPQTWQIPLSVQLSLSKSSKLRTGETISATVTLKNHSDQAFRLVIIDDFFYVTAKDLSEINTSVNGNDLAVKESADTLRLYPSPNKYRRGQVETIIKANGIYSSGDLPVAFGRTGRYFVRGLVRITVRNIEEGGETEVMLYSRETFVNVGI